MKGGFLLALLVTAVIFFSFSIYSEETYLIKNSEYYVTPGSPFIVKFGDFGGSIKLSVISNGNLVVTLDNKHIKIGKWVPTQYIGIHKLVISTFKNLTLEITLIAKGVSSVLQIVFGSFIVLSSIMLYLNVRKNFYH